MSSNSKPFVSGKNAYTIGTHSALKQAKMMKVLHPIFPIAIGVICTTVKTHIQLMKLARLCPFERIRVVHTSAG